MFALGRAFNLATSATTAATPIRMDQCQSVTIAMIGATSGNATLQETKDNAGTGAQNLARITTYWTWSAGVWTKHTQAAAATATAAAGGLLVFEVDAAMLDDLYNHITVSHATGSFVIIQNGLAVQRGPANLASNLT